MASVIVALMAVTVVVLAALAAFVVRQLRPAAGRALPARSPVQVLSARPIAELPLASIDPAHAAERATIHSTTTKERSR